MSSWQSYVQAIIMVTGILLPTIIPLLKSKQYLSSDSKKVLYKLPLFAFLISLGLSILLEIVFILVITLGPPVGEGSMIIAFWPIMALGYIIMVTFIVFLISLGLFYRNKWI